MQRTLLYTLLGGALLISPTVRAQLINKQAKQGFGIEKVLKTVSTTPRSENQNIFKTKAKYAKKSTMTRAEEATPITPDWSTTFTSEEDFEKFTTIDANNDAVDKGTYKEEAWSCNGSLTFFYSNNNTADDWLMSPAVKLSAGRSYKIKISVRTFMPDKHKLEIKFGNAPTVEGMTETAMAKKTVPAYSDQTIETTITPSAKGTYYIGLHALSDPCGYNLYLNSFEIKALGEPTVPAAVTAAEVTADPDAALKATIKFTAPSFTNDGKKLTDLKGVTVKRNDKQIANLTDVVAGKEYTYIDNSIEKAGTQTYVLTPYNEEGEGEATTVEKWVGLDIPASTERPVLSNPSADKLQATWKPYGAANGGVIRPDDITYEVWSVETEGYNAYVKEKKGEVKGQTTLVTDEPTETGKQTFAYQAVKGINDSGASQFSLTTPVLVGKSYDLPVREDFADQAVYHFWGSEQTGNGENTDPAAGVGITTMGNDADGNGSALLIRTVLNDVVTMKSGKLNLKSYSNPTLSFKFASNATSGTFFTFVERRDGLRVNLAEEPQTAATSSWTLKQYSLKDYASEDWVRVGFTFSDPTGETEQVVYIDDINIDDLKPVDLAVTLEGVPEQVEKGQSGQATVKIRNYGSKAVSSYRLKVTVGDKVINDLTMKRKIASFGTHTYPIDISPAIIELADKAEVKVVVEAADDAVAENNVATANVVYTSPDLVPASDLTVTEAQNTHTLAWKAPSAFRTQTDGFENETSWAISDIGRWTTVDGDEGTCLGLLDSYYVYYGSEGKPFAFTVYDPYNYGDYDITSLFPYAVPKSGTKSLAAFYSAKQDDTTGQATVVDADNWLISPELTGKAQQISFWANNHYEDGIDEDTNEEWAYDYPETFDVLYSTTDTETTSFAKIGDTYTKEGGKWKQYDVQLPEGAKYFAIHHNSKKALDEDGYVMSPWLFQIDDVTYTSSNLKVLKYNIYRDGELLTSTTQTTYADNSATPGTHVYQVTTVYEGDLESVAVTAGAPTGIAAPVATVSDNTVEGIYTIDGKKVQQPVKGISIMKMKDGSAKKIVK